MTAARMIIFTAHARRRMAERRISRAYAIQTIKEPDKIIEESGGVTIFRKRFGGTLLEAVTEIGKRKIVIITLYWL